jgi:predicted dehydrogenase
MRHAVTRGAIGAMRIAMGSFSSSRHGPHGAAWRTSRTASGGGVLLDSAVHLVDVMHWLAGPEDSVIGQQRGLPGTDIEADGGLLMCYDGGPIAMIGATQAGAPGPGPYFRLELLGTEGRIALECSAGRAACRLARPAGERVIAEHPDWWMAANRAALAHYLGNFRAGRPLGENPSESAANLATVLAAYQSADTQRPARPYQFAGASGAPRNQ